MNHTGKKPNNNWGLVRPRGLNDVCTLHDDKNSLETSCSRLQMFVFVKI